MPALCTTLPVGPKHVCLPGHPDQIPTGLSVYEKNISNSSLKQMKIYLKIDG